MPSVKTARVNPFRPLGLLYLLVRSMFRYFVSGQSVTGRKTDNASMWHAATKDHRDKPVEKLSGPIWQRLARRWIVAGMPVVFLIFAVISVVVRRVLGFFGATPWIGFRVPWSRVAIGWELVAFCAFAGFGYALFASWWKTRKTTNEFVYPAWQAATQAMGVVYHKRDARKMVALPEGFRVDEEEEVDELPSGFRRAIALRFPQLGKKTLADVLASQEAVSEADTTASTDEPGTDLVLRPRSVVARWRGRRLDEESQTPAELPEPPPVTIKLYPGKVSTPAAQKAFLSAVSGPLGMPDLKPSWYLRGRSPYVELRPNLAPPPIVTFAQIQRHIEKAPLAQPVMGLAAGNKVVGIDLDNNSPHTMISGASGTGKSVLGKFFFMQRMHNGSGTLMLDYKRVSHRWLHNLDGCVYAWRLADIHDSLLAAGAELERRLETVLPESNDIEAAMKDFQPIDIVIEEINSTTDLLQMYWISELGGKGQSPAVMAIKRMVNMGREYKMFVWILAQRASASVFGSNGGDIRESFQTRLMAKWTLATWKMLAGGAQYQRPIGGRGVWARVQDDEVEIVRVPFITNAEARAWASSGVPSPATPDVLPDRLSGPSGAPGSRAAEPADIGPQLVALSAALKHLPPDGTGKPLSISGLRTASRRPGFPEPKIIGGATRPSLYDLDDLIGWRASQVGETAELTEMFEQPTRPSEIARSGIVYQADTLNPESGSIEVGYIGQTRRTLAEREREHRGDKPWSDLIVGSFRVIWSGDPTDDELDAIERKLIIDRLPRYNIEHQKGALHAVPKWDQLSQRHERDDELGRPRWVPIDVFSGERRTEDLEEWSRPE